MNDSYIVGTCAKMCPDSEIELRKTNRLVHFYESKVMVKEFSRSAADKRRPDPRDIRTFKALNETLEHLFNKILLDPQKPFNFRYDFIFDRCRAIRQEIVMQSFSSEKTLLLLEPIVMFLCLSLYRLSGSKLSVFDPKICLQHLQECLLKCLTCYEEIDRKNQQVASTGRRETIEAIYLMLNVEHSNVLQRALQLHESIKSTFVVNEAIKICLNYHRKNFHRILRQLRELPHLICAVAALKLPHFRAEILYAFSIAYNSKSLSVPIDFLQRSLIYDETEFLLRDLRDLGIHNDSDGENPKKVVFSRTKFNSSKLISNTSQRLVEEKLRDYHLPDLILLKTV